MTVSRATEGPVRESADPSTDLPVSRDVLERASVREILMGAQDNLTNVLAVMLGVSIGSGRADLVALAGVSAAVAEAVSMGGVLYTSTRAEDALYASAARPDAAGASARMSPAQSGVTTFAAALVGGLLPLLPFVALPLGPAVLTSIAISVVALFLLGSATGRISGAMWWREGVRLVLVAGLAALAAAVVGSLLQVA
jgi:VIT1/CCC1 family predicted Fe2+/Mn2+ transporter